MAREGLFISFEGSEGCGKSTQIARLALRLREAGHEVVQLREPGGTPVGEKIRDLLQYDASAKAMTPEAELLLFVASRAQLVREVILPSLERGAVVLCDRFLDSTTVYQGSVRALNMEMVEQINGFAVGDTLPDLTIVLDLDATEGRRRAFGRKGPVDRMEQESGEFYESVRQGFLKLAQSNPRFKVVDGSKDADTLEGEIAKLVGERFQSVGGHDGIH